MEATITPEDRIIYSTRQLKDDLSIVFTPCRVDEETARTFVIRHWDESKHEWGYQRNIHKCGMTSHDNHYFKTKAAAICYFASKIIGEVKFRQRIVDDPNEPQGRREWSQKWLDHAAERLSLFCVSNAGVIAEFSLQKEVMP